MTGSASGAGTAYSSGAPEQCLKWTVYVPVSVKQQFLTVFKAIAQTFFVGPVTT
jgi:hypothetical protein